MRIALSVEALSPHLTGIGRYTWELCRGLSRSAAIADLRYFRSDQWIADPAVLLVDDAPAPRRRRFLGSALVRRMESYRTRRNRLFHGPNYFLPPFVEAGVITVHDLSVFAHPETHPVERLRHFDKEFASSVARAAHIITDSKTTRDEVIAFTGVSPERVTAVALGASPAFRPATPEQVRSVLDRYGLAFGRYGLSVSTLEPRKKISELLEAWRGLPTAERSRWPLVVAGGEGWLGEDMRARLARGEEEGWVKYLGYVPEAELVQLYAGAGLFVFPSTYEGFGLPVIEAMACGVPTMVADRSCLPEVTQGAAMLIDPEDIDGFSKALERGLTDAAWRAGASSKGMIVARSYDWGRCIDETIGVYQRASVQ